MTSYRACQGTFGVVDSTQADPPLSKASGSVDLIADALRAEPWQGDGMVQQRSLAAAIATRIVNETPGKVQHRTQPYKSQTKDVLHQKNCFSVR